MRRRQDGGAAAAASAELVEERRDDHDAALEGAVDLPVLAPAASHEAPAPVETYQEQEAGAGQELAGEAAAELPWLDRIDATSRADERGDAGTDPTERTAAQPDLDEAADETPGVTPEALPEWMAWVGDTPAEEPGLPHLADYSDGDDAAHEAALPVEEITALLEDGAAAALEPTEDPDAAAPEPAPASTSPAAASEASPEMRELAERLERFASSLRSHSPAELLSNADPGDPLELLLAGYALGYSRKREQGS